MSDVVVSSGTNSGTTLSGNDMYVYGSGIALSTTVDSGAAQIVYSGGTASDTAVMSGGELVLESGGTVLFTTVGYGGVLLVSGGVAEQSVISGGGGGKLRAVRGDRAGSGSGVPPLVAALPCGAPLGLIRHHVSDRHPA